MVLSTITDRYIAGINSTYLLNINIIHEKNSEYICATHPQEVISHFSSNHFFCSWHIFSQFQDLMVGLVYCFHCLEYFACTVQIFFKEKRMNSFTTLSLIMQHILLYLMVLLPWNNHRLSKFSPVPLITGGSQLKLSAIAIASSWRRLSITFKHFLTQFYDPFQHLQASTQNPTITRKAFMVSRLHRGIWWSQHPTTLTWVPLTTRIFIHKNLLVLTGTRYNPTFWALMWIRSVLFREKNCSL